MLETQVQSSFEFALEWSTCFGNLPTAWVKNDHDFDEIFTFYTYRAMFEEVLTVLLTKVGGQAVYDGCSLALVSMGSTLSLVKSHVSMWARITVASSLCSSSNSVAMAFSREREFELCCIAASMRAFSLLGTRPNRTAAKRGEKRLGRFGYQHRTGWSRFWAISGVKFSAKSKILCGVSSEYYWTYYSRESQLKNCFWTKCVVQFCVNLIFV